MEYVGYQTKKPNLLCKIELRSEQLLMLVEVASQTQALNNWNFSMKKEMPKKNLFSCIHSDPTPFQSYESQVHKY